MICSKEMQLLNESDSISVIECGSTIIFNDSHELNSSLLILVTRYGIEIRCNEMQFLNTFFPMEFKEQGIEILSNDLQSSKELLAILVTSEFNLINRISLFLQKAKANEYTNFD